MKVQTLKEPADAKRTFIDIFGRNDFLTPSGSAEQEDYTTENCLKKFHSIPKLWVFSLQDFSRIFPSNCSAQQIRNFDFHKTAANGLQCKLWLQQCVWKNRGWRIVEKNWFCVKCSSLDKQEEKYWDTCSNLARSECKDFVQSHCATSHCMGCWQNLTSWGNKVRITRIRKQVHAHGCFWRGRAHGHV